MSSAWEFSLPAKPTPTKLLAAAQFDERGSRYRLVDHDGVERVSVQVAIRAALEEAEGNGQASGVRRKPSTEQQGARTARAHRGESNPYWAAFGDTKWLRCVRVGNAA